MLAGPVIGVVSVGYVRAVAWADHHKPRGGWRIGCPVAALTLLGSVSIAYPQILGNGRDVAQLAFTGQVGPVLLLALVVLKPAATLLCLGSGAPGGLFTPSLAFGALLGGALGLPWAHVWPGTRPVCSRFSAPVRCWRPPRRARSRPCVLMMELTGHARAFIVPLLLVVALATLVARTIEPRSIYDARLK